MFNITYQFPTQVYYRPSAIKPAIHLFKLLKFKNKGIYLISNTFFLLFDKKERVIFLFFMHEVPSNVINNPDFNYIMFYNLCYYLLF